jgi:hypothetical protein
MLAYALRTARTSCVTDGSPCSGGSGPAFWTSMFASYMPSDVLLFS